MFSRKANAGNGINPKSIALGLGCCTILWIILGSRGGSRDGAWTAAVGSGEYREWNQPEFCRTAKCYVYGSYDTGNTLATTVTTYYTFKKNKHGPAKFQAWLPHFFQSVSSPLVVFTSVEDVPYIMSIRPRHLPTFLIATDTVWDVVDLWQGKDRLPDLSIRKNYLEVQNSLDKEGPIHSPELYAVWNLKSYMLRVSTELNPFMSEYFLYSDSGSMRSDTATFHDWPSPARIRRVVRDLPDLMMVGDISKNDGEAVPPPGPPGLKPIAHNHIQGGVLAGSVAAILLWEKRFNELHDQYLVGGHFIGKDQEIYNVIVGEMDVVALQSPVSDPCYDRWFFYHLFFASPSDIQAICPVLTPAQVYSSYYVHKEHTDKPVQNL